MATILLTGASRGIGAATRTALETRGAHVIGQATRAGGDDRNILAADFLDPGAPQHLWEQALERSGGTIDVLVNNAGLFAANPLDRSDIEWLDGWEDTLRINLTAAAQLSRFAVQHWQQRALPTLPPRSRISPPWPCKWWSNSARIVRCPPCLPRALR